jgi:hypothetical protein
MPHGKAEHGDHGDDNGHKPLDARHQAIEHELQKDFDSGDAHKFLHEMKKDHLEVAQVTVDKEFGKPVIVLHERGHDGKDQDIVLEGHGKGWDKVKVNEDGTIEFKNGCKIDKHGDIVFADGTQIQKDGVITDKQGNVLDSPTSLSSSTSATEAQATAVTQSTNVEVVANAAATGSSSISTESLSSTRAAVEELARRLGPSGNEMLRMMGDNMNCRLATVC